jgi:hypothetical protein
VNSRKTSDINEGKMAGISLHSKHKRNRYIVQKILEFLCCLNINRQKFLDFDLPLLETEIVSQLKEIYSQYHSAKNQLMIDIKNELQCVKVETKEVVLHKRNKTLKDMYKLYHDSMPDINF